MFRYITNLRAIVIDIESFEGQYIHSWHTLCQKFKCLFIVPSVDMEREIKQEYPDCHIMKGFLRQFIPCPESHYRVLQILNVNSTEMAYCSKDINFLNRASNFLGGTIWITDYVNYNEASQAPDLICASLSRTEDALMNNVHGFLGESTLFPFIDSKGLIIPVRFTTDERVIPLCMLGRYFGSSHYMYQLHPYSAAIDLNKKEGKPYCGVFNEAFTLLLSKAIGELQRFDGVDGIVSVPTRPCKIDRFEPIRAEIAHKQNIKNLGKNFNCIKDYPPQRHATSAERQENVRGIFKYNGDLYGQNIILIDDVITTGATLNECVRVLYSCGAKKVIALVLAVNQLHGNYWSNEPPCIVCPVCKNKMRLLANSQTKQFFYRCYNCKTTVRFKDAMNMLINIENSKLQRLHSR